MGSGITVIYSSEVPEAPGMSCAISGSSNFDRTLPFQSQVIHPTNEFINFELILI